MQKISLGKLVKNTGPELSPSDADPVDLTWAWDYAFLTSILGHSDVPGPQATLE